MSFLYPMFLAGALAIAIPIALHLLRRDVAPEVPFTAVRLLRRSPLEQTRRKRLRDLLLLLARVAALLLLAAAFARPYFASAAGAPSLRIVALDRSFSMGAPGRFRAGAGAGARGGGRGRIDAAGGGDCLRRSRRRSLPRRAGPARRARAIDAARVGYGATRFGAALRARRRSSPATIPRNWSSSATCSAPAGATKRLRQYLPASTWTFVSCPPSPQISPSARCGAQTTASSLTIVNGGSARGIRYGADFRRPAGGRVARPLPRRRASSVDVPVRYRAAGRGVLTAAIDDTNGFQADNAA